MKIESWVLKWHETEKGLPLNLDKDKEPTYFVLFINPDDERMQASTAKYSKGEFVFHHEAKMPGLRAEIDSTFYKVLYWAELPTVIKISD